MKLLYQYEYNWSEDGYYDFILSWAPNGTYSERCRYRGQRDENGNYTMFFWKLLAIQFAFVLAFEVSMGEFLATPPVSFVLEEKEQNRAEKSEQTR